MTTLHDRPLKALAVLSGVLTTMASLSACVSADAEGRGDAPQEPQRSVAAISLSSGKANDWDPLRPLVITASAGQLTDVVVRSSAGRKVEGHMVGGGTSWRSTERILEFDTKYTVNARAVDAAGLATRERSTFRTVDPETKVYGSISPYGGQVVGVGMPIIVTFDEDIPNRAAAERQLSVETSPRTEGSWYWVNDQMVRWRPRTYWKADTEVVVRSRQQGVNLGGGTWGDDNDRVHFTVGDSLISTVNIERLRMVVEQNGKPIRTIRVTTGKDGWETRNGVKVIMSKDRNVVMDAATLDVDNGDPEYYRLDVEYAMRLTWSGEYLHAAPWSVQDQGRTNVSHGCTGMSTEDASWLFNMSKPGDVVEYTHGTREMEPWNGYTDWTISWADWKAGSAL